MQYIRECLSNSKTPSLVVKDMEKLKKARERCILTATGSDSDSFRSRCASSFSSPSGAGQLRIKQQPETLFDIGQDSMLTLQVRGCIRINCSDNGRVALLIGVYHGQSLLCARKVSQCALVRSGRIQLDERIEFDLSIRDLPRMARYSMLLFQVLAPSTSKSAAASSRKQSYGSTSLANVTLNACSTPPVSASALTNASPLSTCVPLTDLSGQVNPLCWVNCTLFDHKGFLRTGGSTLPMWPSVVDSSQSTLSVATLLRSIRRIRDNACAIDDIDSDELLLNPLGTVVQNPEVDSSTCLTVHFVCPMADERPIFYPSLRSIVDRVAAESTGDSQLPPEYPPNVIWLDCSDFNSPAFSVSATVESPTTKLSGTCLSSPDLRSSHFDYETAESHYSHEVRPRSNSSCGQSVQSNASRPDSGEFVPVQPLIDSCAVANRAESNNRRPSSDESGTRLTVPPQPRTNRSSSLSNLSILAALDGTIQLKPPLHSNTNQTLSNLSLQIPRSSSLSISNEELRRSPASGRKASKAYLQQLREICCKDPLHELSKGDIELVWFLRGLCRTQLPHSLSHLLAGVRWNCSNQVFEMLALLTHWPLLTPEHGLQLLDYAYCDLHVRRFAVRCLAQMSDEQLFLYLLQLVQALKFESYLHSELGTFLLHRALANQHIGHYLFWLLRSEMHEPCVSIKFGLLLEACEQQNFLL